MISERMIARLVLQKSTITLLRASGLGLAAFLGAWDVARLITAGDRQPTAFDLVTCPIVPVMRLLAAYASIPDNLLAWTLFIGNAATYASVGYLVLLFLELRRYRSPLGP
jgi:hypothetical protein